MTDATDTFYADYRWPGWRGEVRSIPLDQALSIYPRLFTAEADVGSSSRRPIAWDELHAFHEDMRRQLHSIPPGGAIRFQIDLGSTT